MLPSQSSSLLLHTSIFGRGASQSFQSPPLQSCFPLPQMDEHAFWSGCGVFFILSILPSQSSSLPLQVSGLGVGALHFSQLPMTQSCLPAPQAFAQVLYKPSSTLPLQLSSLLLHISWVGCGASQVSQRPARHNCIPVPH